MTSSNEAECGNPIDGRMYRFSPEDKNLLAFIALKEGQLCDNAVVLVPGLTDGFMALNYTKYLCDALVNYSLVQVNLSTSFYQFGFHSLSQDSTEIGQLMQFLVSLGFKKIVLLGHSTGCQSSLYFLRHSPLAHLVHGVVLQAGISDRDGLYALMPDRTERMKREAERLVQEGKRHQILSERYEDDRGAPITADRYLSLCGRMTSDDMFSTDLITEELRNILSPIQVPISLCYSEQDEYVPDIAAQKEVCHKMVNVLKDTNKSGVVESMYFNGDHGLTTPHQYHPFVDYVVKFINTNI